MDAFVLRNVMKRQTAALLACCDSLDVQDAKIAELLGTPQISPPLPDQVSQGRFYRISFFFRCSSSRDHLLLHVFVKTHVCYSLTGLGRQMTLNDACLIYLMSGFGDAAAWPGISMSPLRQWEWWWLCSSQQLPCNGPLLHSSSATHPP